MLNNIVYYTQQFFFAREKERWEQYIPQWIVKNEEQVFAICEEMGLAKEIAPRGYEFDAVAVFGANKSEIYRRFRYFVKLIKTDKIYIKNRIYLLTGDRLLTDRIDGSAHYISSMKSTYHGKLYETQLMLDLYNKYVKKALTHSLELKVIDTKATDSNRPNTVDTLIQLQHDLDVRDKKILFISRSPSILEQSAAVDRVFTNINYEVVGAGCSIAEVRDKAKAAYHSLMALAGAIYENYMNVAKALVKQNNLHYQESDLIKFKKNLSYRNAKTKYVVFSDKPLTSSPGARPEINPR